MTARGTTVATTVHRSVIDVDGIRSPLLQAGPADAAEAVVCCHGNPGSSADWGNLVGLAGAFTRTVAFDQPGFGTADDPPGFDHTYDGHAAHLDRVLDNLGIRRAHLVGHDLGSRWMLEWAAQRPERFASAVVVAGGVLLDYRWHYLARIWRRPGAGEVLMALNSRRAFRLMMRYGQPRPLPRNFVDRMYDDMDAGTRRAILALYRPDYDWNQRSHTLSRTLRRLDRPALVLWGRHDKYIPVAQAGRQLESLPRARVRVLKGSGHWPFVDDAPGFEQVVLPFLRSVVTGAGPGTEASGTPPLRR